MPTTEPTWMAGDSAANSSTEPAFSTQSQARTKVASAALRLVLPHVVWRTFAMGDRGFVGYGPLALQPVSGGLLALVPTLSIGLPDCQDPTLIDVSKECAPPRLARGVTVAIRVGSRDGRLVASEQGALERLLALWMPDRMLDAHDSRPDLLLIIGNEPGPTSVWLRKGAAWERLKTIAPQTVNLVERSGGRVEASAWIRVPDWHLPGPGMRRNASTACLQKPSNPDAGSRHSRQALALSSAVLSEMQNLRVGIVGVDMVGSALATSLVRLGVDVCAIDPKDMGHHDLQADLAPWHEGRPRVIALSRQLQGLAAEGQLLYGSKLPVESPIAGSIMASCDLVVACTSGSALHAAQAWALACLKPFLAIRTQATRTSCEAWLALLPPGEGCLECTGRWPHIAAESADFSVDALRSWSVMVANMGLRLLEHLVSGRVGQGVLLRYLHNTADGGLRARDWRPDSGTLSCPHCRDLAGAGLGAIVLTRP